LCDSDKRCRTTHGLSGVSHLARRQPAHHTNNTSNVGQRPPRQSPANHHHFHRLQRLRASQPGRRPLRHHPDRWRSCFRRLPVPPAVQPAEGINFLRVRENRHNITISVGNRERCTVGTLVQTKYEDKGGGVVTWYGLMRTAVATELEGKIYRGTTWLSYDFGTEKTWLRGQPVPKATPVSFPLKMIHFSI
jgi:hypothetical protein